MQDNSLAEHPLPHRHLEFWLACSMADGPSAAQLRQWRSHYPDTSALAAALLSSPELRLTASTRRAIADALDWVQRDPTHHLIGLDSPHYPPNLAALADAPPVLYVRGRLEALEAPHVAIVGARKASRQGVATAERLAAELGAAGLHVVSGLALGIDAAAHRGCLHSGAMTVALAATPVDRVYPARHRDLAHEIEQQGAIVSEFPFGTPLQRHCFPRRNRLISGLSLGVVLVEAGLPSGSLTTARHAIDQGREVLAVPDSIHGALARGCHQMIRDGATLVENTEHILQALEPSIGYCSGEHASKMTGTRELVSGSLARSTSRTISGPASGATSDRTTEPTMHAGATSGPNAQDARILQALGTDMTTVEELAQVLDMDLPELLASLSRLEIGGHVYRGAGARYACCPRSADGALAPRS